MFKASDLKMELRSLFHLNHFVVLPYSVFLILSVSDLPRWGIEVDLIVPASFLHSYSYRPALGAFIFDLAFLIPKTIL